MESTRRGVRLLVVTLAAVLQAACWAPDELCGDEQCGTGASGLIGPCESFGCGGNASIGASAFHELRVGLPNEEGIVITGFNSGTGAVGRLALRTPMVLDLQGDRIVGLVDGQPPVEGRELVGATIHLQLRSGRPAYLRIMATEETEFWVSAEAGPAKATVYAFNYALGTSLPGSSTQRAWGHSLCAPSTTDEIPDPRPTLESGSAQYGNLSVAFAGDRYDSRRGTVEVPGDPGWFNIACVGTALAKTHLLRHTTAGNGSTESPSRDERQAMVKLFSADYCGDGSAYARSGTPLFFQDQAGRFDPTPWFGDRVAEVEAIWTAGGALCLDEPRRWDPAQSSAELRAGIVAACESSPVESLRRTIPRCTAEQLASWQSFGHLSRNVAPP